MGTIIIVFAFIALVDLLPLLRRHSRGGALTFVLFFAVSLTLAILQRLSVAVPSVLLFLGDVLKSWNLSY